MAAAACAIPVTILTGRGTVLQETRITLAEITATTLRSRHQEILNSINSHNTLMRYMTQ